MKKIRYSLALEGLTKSKLYKKKNEVYRIYLIVKVILYSKYLRILLKDITFHKLKKLYIKINNITQEWDVSLNRVDVSIIIPVYNVQEYLSVCLDSVVKQTIKNKEIIVINDGSTDKCYEILTEYKRKFPEIIIINQKNRGISETRNAGLKAASGEYIAFVDSDDFIELNMFEKMYKSAKRENADIVICNYILYNEM